MSYNLNFIGILFLFYQDFISVLYAWDVKDKIRRYWKWELVGVILVVATVGLYIFHWEHHEPLLEVYFFSLNKGRAIFMRTPRNKTLLLGGGQTSEIIREITKVMPFYRRKIDYVIIPSATPTQIGGLVEILDRYEIGEIIIPRMLATSTALTALESKIRKQKIHTDEVERGDKVAIEDDLKMEVLFPNADYKFNKSSLPELGLSISYDSTAAYFLGNLSKTIQKDISKTLATTTTRNILEFYNTAAESKVSPALLGKINPSFIFSTKEKTAHAVSSGESWEMTR